MLKAFSYTWRFVVAGVNAGFAKSQIRKFSHPSFLWRGVGSMEMERGEVTSAQANHKNFAIFFKKLNKFVRQ
jgi:hypothetical protein